MSLNITGRNLEITPAIREFVETKIARVTRHFDQVIDTHVILSIEPQKHNAEVTLRVRGKDIHCEASNPDLYAAIDLLIDKADRLVIKYKSKQQGHNAESIKHQELSA